MQSIYHFNVRPHIIFRVQVWNLTGPKHEPDGLVLKPCFGGHLQCGQEHCLVEK